MAVSAGTSMAVCVSFATRCGYAQVKVHSGQRIAYIKRSAFLGSRLHGKVPAAQFRSVAGSNSRKRVVETSLIVPAELRPGAPIRISPDEARKGFLAELPAEVPQLTSDDISVLDCVPPDGKGRPPLEEYGIRARPLVDSGLKEFGAVLIRGFPVDTPQEGERVLKGLGYKYTPYNEISTNDREVIPGTDMELASAWPSAKVFDLHNELSYFPRGADLVFLFMMEPAKHGGESLIASNLAITNSMPADLIAKAMAKKAFQMTMRTRSEGEGAKSGVMTWQKRWNTQDRDVAERGMYEKLHFPRGSVRWDDDGSLTAVYDVPLMKSLPEHDKPIWYNQLHYIMLYRQVLYADGEPIEPILGAEAQRSIWANTKAVKLQKGDLLITDNNRMMHGRTPFIENDDGKKRKLMVALALDASSNSDLR